MSIGLQGLADAIDASGLVRSGTRGVAMLSGGPDSACLAAGLVALLGPDNVDAIHINYRLRPGADADEAVCRDLCGRLRVDLRVERPTLPAGNVQAAAREARYEAAERLRSRYGSDWIATGHSRSDLAETMLYRLAASPGRRALLGMAPRRGRLVRPLLSLGREQLRDVAVGAGLPFSDDPSNQDPRYARSRIRGEVLPVLREISPEVERNLVLTWREIAQEADALDGQANSVLAASVTGEPAAGAPGRGAPAAGQGNALPTAALVDLHPGVRRIV
ncbi:MAG TPA: tRNA lysidine(34) synthetase TilS, partial [Solirubrobacterales bacterium]|nr:tRNA lysidine(34) synthetase TilS [Solirubrobacterales bacterium]